MEESEEKQVFSESLGALVDPCFRASGSGKDLNADVYRASEVSLADIVGSKRRVAGGACGSRVPAQSGASAWSESERAA